MKSHKYNFYSLIFIISLSFFGCQNQKDNIQFSFENIQNIYIQEFSKLNTCYFQPFYIDKSFYNYIEEELNTLLKNVKYSSVLIRVSNDNGICEIATMYIKNNKIYFSIWDRNYKEQKKLIENPKYKKLLKNKPNKIFTLEQSELVSLDSTSEYLIKIIGDKKYYYANNSGCGENSYIELLDTFNKLIN